MENGLGSAYPHTFVNTVHWVVANGDTVHFLKSASEVYADAVYAVYAGAGSSTIRGCHSTEAAKLFTTRTLPHWDSCG